MPSVDFGNKESLNSGSLAIASNESPSSTKSTQSHFIAQGNSGRKFVCCVLEYLFIDKENRTILMRMVLSLTGCQNLSYLAPRPGFRNFELESRTLVIVNTLIRHGYRCDEWWREWRVLLRSGPDTCVLCCLSSRISTLWTLRGCMIERAALHWTTARGYLHSYHCQDVHCALFFNTWNPAQQRSASISRA